MNQNDWIEDDGPDRVQLCIAVDNSGLATKLVDTAAWTKLTRLSTCGQKVKRSLNRFAFRPASGALTAALSS